MADPRETVVPVIRFNVCDWKGAVFAELAIHETCAVGSIVALAGAGEVHRLELTINADELPGVVTSILRHLQARAHHGAPPEPQESPPK